MTDIVIRPNQPAPIVVSNGQASTPTVSSTQQRLNITIPTGPQGPKGDPGNDAQWDSMTLEEYNAIPFKDPNTLYVIVP